MTYFRYSNIIIVMGMIIPWCNSAGLRRRELLNSNMDLDVSSLEQPDIKVGSFVSLQCNVRDKEGYFNWRSCIWRRSRDNKSCKRLYGCAGQFCFVGFGEYKTDRICDKELQDTTFPENNFDDKTSTICRIEIPKVRLEDSGEWICSIQKCTYPLCAFGSYKTIEGRINIKVDP
uniref:Ig-like domain-containing protein n=1 Tax=Lepeophtheirus salmonis TaxID=72036 RepID=A0A0K2V667_LEPSM|nr:uncharacterized protein LOC121114160 [Lepeophtheirus salmonis]XP_040563963.1 uncharacterized protein LOC121114160 [Lepeophtheirus salmonis]XP_040563964.1 uncharacterized protein LOC121114160 [Lepeophtheirus salmonis]XP_040563965.1 uncharacterized protein LOC121114160 [Lepeophtheirus salmonis]